MIIEIKRNPYAVSAVCRKHEAIIRTGRRNLEIFPAPGHAAIPQKILTPMLNMLSHEVARMERSR
jgi:hypothetical protein